MKTKHNLIQVCLISAVLLILPMAVQAQFTFTTNNGAITITAYTGNGGVVTIPATTNGYPITSIGQSAFQGSGVTSVFITNKVTYIGQYAFSFCVSLTNLTFGTNVVNIDAYVAEQAETLPSVTIPNTVTNIGQLAFIGGNALTNITVSAGNPYYTSLNGVLFDHAQTTLIECPSGLAGSYIVPSSVTTIGFGAFNYSHISSVIITNSVTNIGQEAFFNGNLTNLVMGTNITMINAYAFEANYQLASVTLPNTVTFLGARAFSGCNLSQVTIPSSVTYIGELPFGSLGLTNITVVPGNPYYSSVNGVLFDFAQDYLVQYPAGIQGGYSIPNTVTVIGPEAFSENPTLTSVVIPNSVTNIDYIAFGYCFGLTNVSIGTNVTIIDTDAFIYCNRLSSIVIPDSVTTIGFQAFEGCTNLASVTIGSGVDSIGAYAFTMDASLRSLYFRGNQPSPTNDATVFSQDSNITAYYLPKTTGWGSAFDSIPAVLETPTLGIGTYASQPAVFFPTATGTNFLLQMSTNLASGNWATISNGIPISGIVITNPAANAFFRLH